MISKFAKQLVTRNQIFVGAQLSKSFIDFNKPPASIHRGEMQSISENTLWDIPGAKTKKKILGRGRRSGKGKTSGFGHKGQGQRHTKKYPRFEGGQSPLHKRLPKIRLRQLNEIFEYVTIDKLLYGIKRGWIDPSKEITIKDMFDNGLIAKPKYGVVLRPEGFEKLAKLNTPLRVEVSDADPEAIEAIQNAGGNVIITYRTLMLMNQHLRPERYTYEIENPVPPREKLKELVEFYKMGCETRFNMPDWLRNDLEAGKEYIEEFDNNIPGYPVVRYPGMSQGRIRKRKEVIEKEIRFDFTKD